MPTFVLAVLNLGLVVLFAVLFTRRGLLGYTRGGQWYLTWLSIGVITLMDEATSIFYAPAEAHRFIGVQAIFFIAVTSLIMRVLSSRMVEIAQILELNNIRGGGVYSFSYLVLGPVASLVAVASILVDYILTACLSTVSAVINGTAFLPIGPEAAYGLILAIIWGVAGLNILGIRENARVTFAIFVVTVIVFVNLIALGFIYMDPGSPARMLHSATGSWRQITHRGVAHGISIVTVGVASCVLAYSGIESVLQTAGLVENWRVISRAYWFLALTVGIVTPLISALALSAPIDFAAHEGDLIPHWASMVSTPGFAMVVGLLGSLILIMAVNTAYVASGELLERFGHRYRIAALLVTNRRGSFYRIHGLNAVLYTAIILVTAGSQMILAEMYAIGLLASFCINVGCLLIYRYFQGTREIRGGYVTSRAGTLALEVLLVACFIYLALHKPYGTALWATIVALFLVVGIPFTRRYGPERRERRLSDHPLEMVLDLAEADGPLHLWFRRPGECEVATLGSGHVLVTFFSQRSPIPPKLGPHHYRFPIQVGGLYRSLIALLDLVQEEMPSHDITLHFGWPTSSWLDRLSTGMLVANLLRLPRSYPAFNFDIGFQASGDTARHPAAPENPPVPES